MTAPEHKTVLITGTRRGVGKALAEKFLAEGFTVFGTSKERLAANDPKHMIAFELDLSIPESITQCVEGMRARNQKIDILINNAGVLLDEDETAVVPDKLRKTLEINLIGTIDFTERMLPLLGDNAHIVNISSTAGSIEETGHGFSHDPGHYPAYKISKAALNMYTRTLALRLKKKGLTASAVHPGWVKTDMGGSDAPRLPEEAAARIYELALSYPESGHFWFDGKKLAW